MDVIRCDRTAQMGYYAKPTDVYGLGYYLSQGPETGTLKKTIFFGLAVTVVILTLRTMGGPRSRARRNPCGKKRRRRKVRKNPELLLINPRTEGR